MPFPSPLRWVSLTSHGCSVLSSRATMTNDDYPEDEAIQKLFNTLLVYLHEYPEEAKELAHVDH